MSCSAPVIDSEMPTCKVKLLRYRALLLDAVRYMDHSSNLNLLNSAQNFLCKNLKTFYNKLLLKTHGIT